jgi:urocanate hydratase
MVFYSIQGMFFWDYGNAFLLESRRAGANISASSGLKKKTEAAAEADHQVDDDAEDSIAFRYPSYVQDIMG